MVPYPSFVFVTPQARRTVAMHTARTPALLMVQYEQPPECQLATGGTPRSTAFDGLSDAQHCSLRVETRRFFSNAFRKRGAKAAQLPVLFRGPANKQLCCLLMDGA